jgi:hypothetical protein
MRDRRRQFDLALAEFLLEQAADINAQDWAGMTPLHWAVLGHDEFMVKWLLERGGNPLLHQHVETPWKRNSVEKDIPLHIAARDGDRAIAEVLLSLRYHDLLTISRQIHHQNARSRTPLHEASVSGHLEIVKTILSHMTTLDYIVFDLHDDKVFTPMDLAKFGKHTKIYDALIQRQSEIYQDMYPPPASTVFNSSSLHWMPELDTNLALIAPPPSPVGSPTKTSTLGKWLQSRPFKVYSQANYSKGLPTTAALSESEHRPSKS